MNALTDCTALFTARSICSLWASNAIPAADALGISQPAVSLQVRQLEQFLQTRLLERTGRGIKATAAGMAL
ncbi:LysR family transcriptional regulator, partial [Klebsiella pneumoniae]|uniref:LysR family transcriptional regulator n=1 Tax=Klebsiella pneumoniae TaxID=573 RepID=UPI0025547012